MSRQNFYRGRKRRGAVKVDEDLVVALVQRERAQQPRLGTRKLLRILREELTEAGIRIGRDRLFALLGEAKLLLEPLRGTPRTTRWDPSLPSFANRLQAMALSHPHEAWVADLTYVRTEEGFSYLWLITDAYSRKIVGWHASTTPDAASSLRALRMAMADLPSGAKPVHHSDRGCQYASHDYVRQLQGAGLAISMTQQWHCYENAKAERVNGILKQEYGLGETFSTHAGARRAIAQAIWLYNNRRPHLALNYRVPSEVHAVA
jgi:putative transposase